MSESIRLQCDCRHFGRVRVDDAVDVMSRTMDSAMQGESSRVCWEFRRTDQIPVLVDFYQVFRRDLAIIQSKGVDEIVAFRARYPHGNMVENQLGPVQIIDEVIEIG